MCHPSQFTNILWIARRKLIPIELLCILHSVGLEIFFKWVIQNVILYLCCCLKLKYLFLTMKVVVFWIGFAVINQVPLELKNTNIKSWSGIIRNSSCRRVFLNHLLWKRELNGSCFGNMGFVRWAVLKVSYTHKSIVTCR